MLNLFSQTPAVQIFTLALGAYGCEAPCGDGFSRSAAGACKDIDECLESPCTGANEICVNGEGGYSCDCAGGFDLLIDVCVSETCDNFPSICAIGEECVSVEGGTFFS